MSRKAQNKQKKDAMRRFTSEWAKKIKQASGLSARDLEIEFPRICNKEDGDDNADGRVWRSWMEGSRIPRYSTFLEVSHIADEKGWGRTLDALKGAKLLSKTEEESEIWDEIYFSECMKAEVHNSLAHIVQRWITAGGSKKELLNVTAKIFESLLSESASTKQANS